MANATPRLLHELVERRCAIAPEATALWWQGEQTSYAALWRDIETVAGRLAAEGEPGERVAVLAWNRPEFLTLMYAVPAAGQLLVPLNARLAPAEWREQLARAGTRRLFGAPELLAKLDNEGTPGNLAITPFGEAYTAWREGPTAPLPHPDPDGSAWLLFTSGSTGRPKGALLSHASFLAGLESAALGRPVEPSDRYYYPFPLFHVAAHNVMLQHQYGAAVVLTPTFDAGHALADMRDTGVTTMSLAPTMIAMLIDHPDFSPRDLDHVRTIGYGASAMPVSLLRRLQALSPVGLCQSFGMTELSGSVSFLTVEDHRRAAAGEEHLLDAVGQPLPTAKLRLVDDNGRDCATGDNGEVLVKAKQVMRGYWQDEAATAAALAGGWLHTGDIGRFDADGYLYIVDRKKDMIISGGENVASREVEEALRGHPAVADCAVIGLPDARWGETVCAVIVAADPVEEAMLAAHCRALLAGYKTPRRWFFTDALPLNAAGKVDKPWLRLEYGD